MGKSELLFTTRDELGIKNVAEYEKLTLKQTMEIQLQKGSVKSDTKISD